MEDNLMDAAVSSSGSVRSLDSILEMIPVGKFHYRLLFICGMSFMEAALLSFLSICAGATWNLSDSKVASISSCVFAGVLFGNLFFGPFADAYGRRKAFILGSFIIILFGFLTGFAPNYVTLLLFRMCCGFGIGGGAVPFDLLAEFLPQKHRGEFLININYFWSIGSMFVAGCAWLMLTSEGWHQLAIYTAIPVSISMAYAVYILPESPRWLLINGRVKEAEIILKEAARYNGTPLPEFSLQSLQLAGEQTSEHKISISEFFEKKNLPVTIPLWIVWLCFGFTYYGTILLISRIYQENGDDDGDDDGFVCDFQYGEIFISAVSEIPAVLMVRLLIDSWGRCNTQVLTYGVAGISVIFLGIRATNQNSFSVLVFSFISRMFVLGATCATWVATPELFDTHLRATGHSISSSMARMGAFICPFVVANYSLSTLTVTMIICIVNLTAAGASYMLPETKDKILDEDRLQRTISSQGTYLPMDAQKKI